MRYWNYYYYHHHHHLLVITFMQGVYNYIPDTNHVSRVYGVAAVLYLQTGLHVILLHVRNTFRTLTFVHSAECVQCPIRLFFVVPKFHAFLVRYSRTVWVILKWLQSSLLLQVTFLLSNYYYIKSCCVCNHHYQDWRILFIWLVESNLPRLWLENHSISFSGSCVWSHVVRPYGSFCSSGNSIN